MIRTVAVPVLDQVLPFELGVLCEVFGTPRPDDAELPSFAFQLCSAEPGPVRTVTGFSVVVERGWDALDEADLIAIPAMRLVSDLPQDLLDRLAAAHRRGAQLLSVCNGAFLLAAAGILDGRACTTHWMHVEELRRLVPSAHVDPDVLYVEDDNVLTSAGTAAGIDASLHLIRREFGTRVANRLARRMVMPPHREGGQRQYVEQPVPCEVDTLADTLEWMQERLGEEMTVDRLAARAHLSPRTFARRFRAETGTTPHSWLTGQRILFAQRLLEDSEQSIDAVAELAGFGSAAVLRHHFVRRIGTTPQAYRRTFRRRPA